MGQFPFLGLGNLHQISCLHLQVTVESDRKCLSEVPTEGRLANDELTMNNRRGVRRWSEHTVLPLRSARELSNTVSIWYCDYKFSLLNETLFRFGRRYSRQFKVWFSIGIGFSLASVLGVSLFLLYELALGMFFRGRNGGVGHSLFEISPWAVGFSNSLPSVGYFCISSFVSLIVHEFGHAVAAASEGVQIEYVALFWAVLFPGALVAFNNASLQTLPQVASLRIYCAGVWHNAVFSALCALGLFLLPLLLSPFYIYNDCPMVLDIDSDSPFSGYVSPGDVILSLNGISIRSAEDWKKSIALLMDQAQTSSSDPSRVEDVAKGYCIPDSLIERSIHAEFGANRTYCPDELSAFMPLPCPDTRIHDDGNRNSITCLDAKDVIKLKSCELRNTSICFCSESELCSIPVQLPGAAWVGITYSTPECLERRRNTSSGDAAVKGCLRTSIFVGDLISMSHSIHLTSYKPRWSIYFAPYLPHLLEKLLASAFHVSLVLALLNSLPVFFLDGESILEVSLQYFDILSSRMKKSILRCCLLLGTFICTISILQTIFTALG